MCVKHHAANQDHYFVCVICGSLVPRPSSPSLLLMINYGGRKKESTRSIIYHE